MDNASRAQEWVALGWFVWLANGVAGVLMARILDMRVHALMCTGTGCIYATAVERGLWMEVMVVADLFTHTHSALVKSVHREWTLVKVAAAAVVVMVVVMALER